MTRKGVLLALDYPGRRDESRIRDLHLESDGWDVRYLLEAPFPSGLTADAYANELRHRANCADADVVMAYCSGAPIAQELVAQLRRPVPVVLFDGEPSLLSGLRRDAAAAAAQFGVPDSTARSGPATTMTDNDITARPEHCFAAIRTWLVDLARGALLEDGATNEEARDTSKEIASFYLDWFVFLIAAHNTTWPSIQKLRHLVSHDHLFLDGWPGVSDLRLTKIEAGRNDLLAAPQTRSAAVSILAELVMQATRP